MRNFLTLSILILLSVCLSGHQVIDNPDKPTNPNHGRVLQLEEVMRITGDGEDLYFKMPGTVCVDKEGLIYVMDSNRLFQLTRDGRLIKNLIAQGQGPGEIQRGSYFHVTDDGIYILDSTARKVVHLDKDGELMNEFSFKDRQYSIFYGLLDDKFVFRELKIPEAEQMTGKVLNRPSEFVVVSKDGENESRSVPFEWRWYFQTGKGIALDPFFSVNNEDFTKVYVNNTAEYEIKVLNLRTNAITRVFKRKYKRVKMPERPASGVRGGPARATSFKPPKRTHSFDISRLILNEDDLWVMTSTTGDEKGTLYDVFNSEGKYIDCFYVKKGIRILLCSGDMLYSLERDSDFNYSIIKYRILNY